MNTEATPVVQEPQPFDFEAHSRAAVAEYEHVRPKYESLCKVLEDVVSKALASAALKVASIEGRAKSLKSFQRKASEPSEGEPNQPKYAEPLVEITDLAGLRIIAFFLDDLRTIEQMIGTEFEVVERSDKSELLIEGERFGYRSTHYLVMMKANRTGLPEYTRFKGVVAEVQIRTILQHAWGEIEHDIQYRSTETIPLTVRRRFMSLAGLLEIADREFQAVQNEDNRLRAAARESVESGDLEAVEVTPDALKTYLDRRFGSDDRIALWSYSWMATQLKKLGVNNFKELDEAIAGFDDDSISRLVWGSRQGQMSRFESTLLAAFGARFFRAYSGADYQSVLERSLERIRSAGIGEGSSLPIDPAYYQGDD